MKPEKLHAHLTPLFFAVNEEVAVSLQPDDASVALPNGEYEIRLTHKSRPSESWTGKGKWGKDGRVSFQVCVAQPGECWVDVHMPGRWHRAGSVYVLDADLAKRTPLRGDLHVHTWYSDGRSSPKEALQEAMKLGFDFLAITDHDCWEGSQDAIAVAADVAPDLLVLSGEEVTFDQGHLVAVGIEAGVASATRSPGYERELEAIESALVEADLCDGLTAKDYARALWSARRIRELGGLAFLAHPFWQAGDTFHLDRRIAWQLTLDKEIDGIELIGDVEYEDNMLSIASYMILLSQGVETSVIGCSDTHGIDHTFGWHWTTVFAEERSVAGVLSALKQGYSVACTRIPGERLRIYGPLRLVEYAYFLHRSFFTDNIQKGQS